MPVTFPYDQKKAHQAALWFLHRHGGALEVLKLVKLIFFADRLHLFRYGRPITGGIYCALPHGPVADALYNDLKAQSAGHPGAEDSPFIRVGNKIQAAVSVDEEYLSESDLEALEETERLYGAFDSFHLRDLTHELKAYTKNDPGNGSRNLPYEDFFEDLPADERWMLEIIREDNEARNSLG